MTKPEVVICTCVYNRFEKTLPSYLKSLEESMEGVNYIVYLILNTDDKFKAETFYKSGFFLDTLCDPNRDNSRIQIIETPNTGLMGYNIGLEFGRIYDCSVMLCNDDTVFDKCWYELLHVSRGCDCHGLQVESHYVMKENKEIEIRPETIGVIAPCYVNPGCMKHQKYDVNKSGFTAVDFCVGHAQVITREAVRAGFTFDPKICELFGPFDVYQSMWMQHHGFNILISQDCCFDFPNSVESHYHEGAVEKFADFNEPWKKMENKLMKEYQPIHIAKHGFNKWFFE